MRWLGANRAILYLDDQGTTEKFRPYRPPTDEWLDRLRRRFRPESAAGADHASELDINEWVIV